MNSSDPDQASLAELENNFVLGCGSSSEDRILSAVNLVNNGPSLKDFPTFRRFGIVDNVTAVVAATGHPFLVYAKYIAVRGLTKVLVFKTEERIQEFTEDLPTDSNVTTQMINANHSTVCFCLCALETCLKRVQPHEDPHKMIPQSVTASLELLLNIRAQKRLTKTTLDLSTPANPSMLLSFINDPATRVIVAVSTLITTLGIERMSRILNEVYSEGLGVALVDVLSTNGVFTLCYQMAQHFLQECTENELMAAKERDAAIATERQFFHAWEYARKESKKGQKKLKLRFVEATAEHKEKDDIMIEKTKIWQSRRDLMEKTKAALNLISDALCQILEVVGFIAFSVKSAQTQAVDSGVIDTLLEFVSQADDGTNEQHTKVKIYAARCLGKCCYQFDRSQQRVAIADGHRALMQLFIMNGNDGHVTKEAAATALTRCCGHQRSSIKETLEDGAVHHLMQYVKDCLDSPTLEASSSSAAAAATIAHLTARYVSVSVVLHLSLSDSDAPS
jgi:hypothetical protein